MERSLDDITSIVDDSIKHNRPFNEPSICSDIRAWDRLPIFLGSVKNFEEVDSFVKDLPYEKKYNFVKSHSKNADFNLITFTDRFADFSLAYSRLSSDPRDSELAKLISQSLLIQDANPVSARNLIKSNFDMSNLRDVPLEIQDEYSSFGKQAPSIIDSKIQTYLLAQLMSKVGLNSFEGAEVRPYKKRNDSVFSYLGTL